MTQRRHRRATPRALLLAFATLLLFVQSGCVSVKPWEKAALARPDMAVDSNPLGSAIEGHIRFSKEGGLPSGGGGGGGCGCN